MARGKSSKSAAIRESLSADPNKPVSEIARDLRVTPSLVYNVKAAMKKNGGQPKRKPGRKPGTRSGRKVTAPDSAHAALDSAFEFVTKVGGLLHAEEILAKLRAIKDRM